MLTAEVTRGDIANYVGALFFVYSVLIIANVVISWVAQMRPIPYNLTLRAAIGFVEETTNPFLGFFRRLIPQFGPLDISPMVALLVIWIGGGIVVKLIEG
jgi:YggT family protein